MTSELSTIGIAVEIKAELQLAEASATSTLIHLQTAGELLLKAKAKVEHGHWENWVNTNLPFGVRQAQKLMRLYTHRNELPQIRIADSLLGIDRTLALLADERGEQDAVEQPVVEQDLLDDQDQVDDDLYRSPEIIEVEPVQSSPQTAGARRRTHRISESVNNESLRVVERFIYQTGRRKDPGLRVVELSALEQKIQRLLKLIREELAEVAK